MPFVLDNPRSSNRGLALAAALLLALLTASCQSAGETEEPESEPYTPAQATEQPSGGYLLAQFDKSLRRWTELKLNPTEASDQRVLRALEHNLTERAKQSRDELVTALETGPAVNRQVAAVALGFSEDPTVMSPLLAALSDDNPSVVQKALLGLGILAEPETPTAKITYLMLQDPDPWTRNNAAYALMCLVAAGTRGEDLGRISRAALIDEEPGVRAQAAGVLGMLNDATAIQALGDLLHDEAGLVAQAAATSLARIGRQTDERKGDVARLLVDSLEYLRGPLKRHVVTELNGLSRTPYGNDMGAWRDWAYRMP